MTSPMPNMRCILADTKLLDLNPMRAGEQINTDAYRVGPTVRHQTVIFYILKGKGVYSVGGVDYPVEAGQAFLVLPEEIFSYVSDADEPWHQQWIVFDGQLAESFRQLPPVFPLNPKYFRNIFSYMEDTAMREIKIASQLHLLYAELFSKLPHGEDYVKRVKNYIHTAYMEPITVEQIAQDMNLDRRYLSWLFKKKTGQTIQQCLINVRLEEAQSHLRQGRSVQEAATLCGYEDVSNFSKMFKQRFGISPAHWKAQIQSSTQQK